VIFKHPKGMNPIPEGRFIGEMTREYDDYGIKEFVAGGPK